MDDDLVDIHYLDIVHTLKAIGELTPGQEELGGLGVNSHDEAYVTRPIERGDREKVVPVLYFGRTALR